MEQKIKTINYFDLGLYKNGLELEEIHQNILPKFNIPFYSFGIEANPDYFNIVREKFKNYQNLKLFNFAISNIEENIKLFKSKNEVGDSIYDSKIGVSKDEYHIVTGKKFSNFIKENNIELEGNINIVKINIEGAEWDFFNDIIENQIHKHIKLFIGSGYDVYKIIEFVENDIIDKYNNLLMENNIVIHHFYMDFDKRKNYKKNFRKKRKIVDIYGKILEIINDS